MRNRQDDAKCARQAIAIRQGGFDRNANRVRAGNWRGMSKLRLHDDAPARWRAVKPATVMFID
jgi:hypothetical protein